MYSNDKYIEMLSSKHASSRYAACEWIRAIEESSPEIVTALEKATHDEDKEVAERAKLALQEEGVHHQMAIEMGIIKPDEIVEEENILIDEIDNSLVDIEDKLASWYHYLFYKPIRSIYHRLKPKEKLK